MSAGPQQDGKPRRLTMLLLDEYQVERMFQKKTYQFGTAAVGIGLSTTAAVAANMFLATTFTSFLAGDFSGGGGGGQQQQQAPQQQRQQPQAERVQQQAREAQSALAKDRKKVALATGAAKPDTLLTGRGVGGGLPGIPGIPDEDLELGRKALV